MSDLGYDPQSELQDWMNQMSAADPQMVQGSDYPVCPGCGDDVRHDPDDCPGPNDEWAAEWDEPFFVGGMSLREDRLRERDETPRSSHPERTSPTYRR